MGAPSYDHLRVLHAAWRAYDGRRDITEVTEVSAFVSTNRVYRLALDDGARVVAKVSSYGSYFLFAEDHDRLYRCRELLRSGRFADFLAAVKGRDGRAYTWYDGAHWAAFYDEVEMGDRLPRVLSDDALVNLGREVAAFHLACAEVAGALPPTSNSVKADAIHLLDLLESPFAPRNFDLPPESIGTLWRSTHDFLCALERIHYDEWPKQPVLIDWNLGNFSVVDTPGGGFRLFTRWDYDWFRVEPRLLDFYFLSRAASRTGDRTQFSYSSHTLVEPRFLTFLRAYNDVFPLTVDEIRFIPRAYQFFLLNYVVREGARFFRPDLCSGFRRETVNRFLPELEHLDITPLLDVVALRGSAR